MKIGGLRHDVVILACAISAGIHGALVRAHFAESAAAGGGFMAAAVLLALVAAALTRYPASALAPAGAAALFAGLLASYAFAITAGVPVLHPEPEPVDGVALATKAVEAVGLLTAVTLVRGRFGLAPVVRQAKGT